MSKFLGIVSSPFKKNRTIKKDLSPDEKEYFKVYGIIPKPKQLENYLKERKYHCRPINIDDLQIVLGYGRISKKNYRLK